MKKIVFLVNFIILLLLTSCGSGNSNISNDDVITSDSRKIQYSYYYDIESNNYKSVSIDVANKLVELEGYVYESMEKNDYIYYQYKVPTYKITSFIDYIDSFDSVTSKIENTKDITLSFNIIEERIITLNSRKEAYESELKSTNLTLEQKLEINSIIDDLNNQIYNYSIEVEKIKNDSDYSLVTVNYKDKHDFWNSLGIIMLKMIYFVGITLMISLPFAIIVMIVFFITRKRKNTND